MSLEQEFLANKIFELLFDVFKLYFNRRVLERTRTTLAQARKNNYPSSPKIEEGKGRDVRYSNVSRGSFGVTRDIMTQNQKFNSKDGALKRVFVTLKPEQTLRHFSEI